MLAVVLGRFDLVRALGLGGIRSVVVTDRDDPIRHSRHVDSVVERDSLLGAVPEPGGRRPLFYDSDAALDYVARERERLAAAHSFVLPDPDLLADLLDKGRFQELARRRGLPVPRAWSDGSLADVRFPVVLKASPFRDGRWAALAGASKVLRVDDEAALREVVARLDGAAIGELFRVLRPRAGELIISVQQERGARTREFGRPDGRHLGFWRTYGDDFAERLEEGGFEVRPVGYRPAPEEASLYGIDPEEGFFICTKPGGS
jgi:hypothetical protein